MSSSRRIQCRVAEAAAVVAVVALLIAGAMMVLGPAPGHAALQPASVSFDPDPRQVMVGDTFDVSLQLTGAPAPGLGGFEVWIGYDVDALDVVAVTGGADVNGFFRVNFEKHPGWIHVLGIDFGGGLTPPDGELAVLTFTAKEVGPTELDLIGEGEATGPARDIALYDSDLDPIASEVEDGTVDVSKRAERFEFAPIADQAAGVPFGITVEALTEDDERAHFFGSADLDDDTGTIAPISTGAFDAGFVTLDVTIAQAQQGVTISASATDPVTTDEIAGASNPFDVIATDPVTLTLEAHPLELLLGESATLTATVLGEGGSLVPDGTEVVFETDLGALGSTIVTKTTTAGVATASLTSQEAGTANVTATAGDASDAVEIVFSPPPAPHITVSPMALTASLSPGGSTTAPLTIGNAGDADLDWTLTRVPPVGWLSAAPTSGTEAPGASTGVVVGFDAAGLSYDVYSAVLQITSNDPDQSIINVPVTLTVELDAEDLVGVTIEPDDVTLEVGECQAFTLTAEDGEGNTFDVTAAATFTASGGGTLTDNEFCAETVGQWTVTGSYQGLDDTATVTVDLDAEDLVGVTIEPDDVTLGVGACQAFTLTAEDGEGNTFDVTAAATFTASGGGTLTDNEFCAETVGQWTVTGSYQGLDDTATVTVDLDAEDLVGVTIEPDDVTLEVGECQAFTLTAEDGEGNTFDVTAGAIFIASGGGTLTVNEFCAETVGQWTVTGSYQGFDDTATVTVEPDEFYIFLPLVTRNHAP